MRESMQVLLMVRDSSVRSALSKAISGDGRLSYSDAKSIIRSTFDGKGTTYQEFKDVQAVLRNAKTLDARARALLTDFCDRWYHQYLLNEAKKKEFNLPYKADHIPSTTANGRRPGTAMKPSYLTIHSTGNPSSNAKGERAWLTNTENSRTASFHVVVDAGEAIECIPFGEVAWHAGDGPSGMGNTKSISVEICESGDRDKALDNGARLAAKILREKGWGASSLKRHRDWATKTCPRILIDVAYRKKPEQTWEWFVAKVKHLM